MSSKAKQQEYFAAIDSDGSICGFGVTRALAIQDARRFRSGRRYKTCPCSVRAFLEGIDKGGQKLTFDLKGRVVTLEENGGLWFVELAGGALRRL